MGVEHYLVCKTCKQYIDLHKAYEFGRIIYRETPPSGAGQVIDKSGSDGKDFIRGGYWESRGLWFLWKHREHCPGVALWTDSNDDWYDLEPKLEEVFRHEDDLKLREKK